MSRPTRPVDIDDDMELVRLRARDEQARDIINALLPSTFGSVPDRDRRDAALWLQGEWFGQCSICRRRHRSDDRHPCE